MIILYIQAKGIINMTHLTNTDHIEWRFIPGYEGVYSVSNTGMIRSEERLIYNNKQGGKFLRPAKILKLRPNQSGYWMTGGHYNGNPVVIHVHQAVCKAFHGTQPTPKHEVRHLDGNPVNNNSYNLAWGTRSENIADAKRHGTFPVGVDRPGAKLNPEIAKAICLDTRDISVIADDYGINKGTVRSIKIGDFWAVHTIEERAINPWDYRRKLTKEELNEIFDMTKNRQYLAKKLGITVGVVDAHRRDAGLSKAIIKVTEADKDMVLDLSNTSKELAAHFGCHISVISSFRKRHGICTREKLTEADKIFIMNSTLTGKELGLMFGINSNHANAVRAQMRKSNAA